MPSTFLKQPTGPALRANPSPEVTDLFCRLPLPTLFYRLEAAHLGDLLRLSVRPGARARNQPYYATLGFSRAVGSAPDATTSVALCRNQMTLSPANPDSREHTPSKKKRQLFPGLPPTSPSSFALPPTAEAASTLRFGNVNPIPFGAWCHHPRGKDDLHPPNGHPFRQKGGSFPFP